MTQSQQTGAKTSFQRNVETKDIQSEEDLIERTVIRYADKFNIPVVHSEITSDKLIRKS